MRPSFRQFYSGRPIWKADGKLLGKHPEGYDRVVDPNWGAFYWTHDGVACVDVDGASPIWDCSPFWEPAQSGLEVWETQPGQNDQEAQMEAYMIEEDIYNA